MTKNKSYPNDPYAAMDDTLLKEMILRELARREASPQYQQQLAEFRKLWAGRKFRCKATGEEFTIPADVYYKAYYTFGNSSVDVGDGYYCRIGGDIEEVKEEGGV